MKIHTLKAKNVHKLFIEFHNYLEKIRNINKERYDIMLFTRNRKFIIFICLLLSLSLTSCKQKNKDEITDSNKEEQNGDNMNDNLGASENNLVDSNMVSSDTENTLDFSSIDLSTVSLKETYKDDFMIGTIYAYNNYTGDDCSIVTRNFNVITPENLMKPEYMQPSESQFYYDGSDRMMEFAKENNLTAIGHTLVWHQQSGNWLGKNVDRDTAIEQLRSHITNIVGHYKGKIYAWDVVNEAVNDGVSLPSDGDWTKCLRSTMWLESIGPEYIALAFQFAHEADPDVKLYYNDYNMNDASKANIVYTMVKDLQEQGVPIHGIGMQGHYNTGTTISSVKKSIDLFSQIEGIEISFTELDVGVSEAVNNQLTKEQEIEQALFYANLFILLKQHADVIDRVTFWGYRDNTSWRSNTCPLLFDSNLEPKEAFFAVLYPEEYLAKHELEKAEKKAKQAVAYFGSPEIDGIIDETWDKATPYSINKQVTAWEGATGTVRLLWDTSYLYALYEVKDAVLNLSSSNAYEQDSIELFLDQNLAGLGYYDESTGQYRVNYEGTLTFGEVPTQEGVLTAAQTTSEGYIIEIAIPLLKVGTKGRRMGFEAQINDSNSSGLRESIAKFSDQTDNSWQSTENWGEVLFK